MIRNDESVVALKHTIVEALARYLWNDVLNEEKIEELIYQISPGPHASWRCCVYKEREILRWRIRLARNQNADIKGDTDNIIQVIKPACEECPIASYTVTDNCRLCLGKACLNACRLDAIYIDGNRTRIDVNKCKECGMCANACPYGAIAHLVRPCKKVCPVDAIYYDEDGICIIDEDKCIRCGKCIHNCPFGAIDSKVTVLDIIEAIKEGKEVYAMLAPATEGQFGDGVSMAVLRAALKKVGFKDAVEVGLGGDMTAAYESEEWSEAYSDGRKMTTSCCPAFINLLKKHYPKVYEENMSTIVSPMCAVSRYIKALHPDAITVFIGPCIAKKSEVKEMGIEGNADHALTYGEMTSLLRSRDIEIVPVEEDYQEASLMGKNFAVSGGVAEAVMSCMRERGQDTSGLNIRRANGGKECVVAATLLNAGKLPEDFVEGMACEGGCIGGPSRHEMPAKTMAVRKKLQEKADERSVLENLKNYPMDKFSMNRDNR